MQNRLKQHLALATGAASAAAATVPMGAGADIVYNAVSVSYGQPEAPWDVDSDSSPDFTFFTNKSSKIYLRCSDGRGLLGNGSGSDTFNNLPSDFALGTTLAAPYQWAGDGDRIVMTGSDVGDNFVGGKIGSNFIGFRFDSGGNTLYGWAELLLSTTDGGTVTVNRWAYNDAPDGGIEVGQTQDNPVPAPGTLALLAAGAFGLRRWRARRAAA